MRVIGLDPGYDRLGVAVLEGTGNSPRLIHSTCLQTDRSQAFHERLAVIGTQFTRILTEHKPEVIALETLFFNKNVKTGIAVAEARGVLLYLATLHGAQIAEYSPQAIKIAVTGYGKSDKTAVVRMVKQLIPNTPTDRVDDEYDAIAVGITCLAHHPHHR